MRPGKRLFDISIGRYDSIIEASVYGKVIYLMDQKVKAPAQLITLHDLDNLIRPITLRISEAIRNP